MKTFDDVINFHGNACPGLALGYRVSRYALSKLGKRAFDEEIVAIVENDSCAIDAVQVMTGCTFGKGNLIFNDFGKQVYTFIKRKTGRGIRISIQWQPISTIAPPPQPTTKSSFEETSSTNSFSTFLK